MSINDVSNNKKTVMNSFVSSMLSTASILTAINASMIHSASSVVKRPTVSRSMQKLSTRAMVKAVGMKNNAFASMANVDTSEDGMVSSTAYLLSSGLFALSTIVIDDGIVSNDTSVSEFQFLSKEELELEIITGSNSVLTDVIGIDSMTFKSLVKDLKRKREQTIRTMYEIYSAIDKCSSKCDSTLAYMDIIRNTYNYTLACIQSCVQAEEYKFNEGRDTDASTISIDIPIPIRLKHREFTPVNMNDAKGELGKYVQLSYDTVNHLVSLTESFVLNNIQTKAFAHFITIPSSFAIFINGKRYAMSHDDVIESCQNFKHLLLSNYSPVFERVHHRNLNDMYDAVYNDIPSYIDRKIELSHSSTTELAVLHMDERYMKNTFQSNAFKSIRRYERVKVSRIVLLDFAGRGDEVDISHSNLSFNSESIYDRLISNWQATPTVLPLSSKSSESTYITRDHDSIDGERTFDAWDLTVGEVLYGNGTTNKPFKPSDKSISIKRANNHILNRLALDKEGLRLLLELPSENIIDTTSTIGVGKTRSLYELYQGSVDHFKNSHIPRVKRSLNIRERRTLDLKDIVDALHAIKGRMIFDDVILSVGNEVEQMIQNIKDGTFMGKLENEGTTTDTENDSTAKFHKVTAISDVQTEGLMTVLLTDRLVSNSKDHLEKHFTFEDVSTDYKVKGDVHGDFYYYEEALPVSIPEVEVETNTLHTDVSDYSFYIENYYSKESNKLGIMGSQALEVFIRDHLTRVGSLVFELQSSIDKTSRHERFLTSSYNEGVIELMDDAHGIMKTVSNINEITGTLTKINNCIERAGAKVDEIVNIRNHLKTVA